MIITIVLLSLSLFLEALLPCIIKDFIPFFSLAAILIATIKIRKKKQLQIILFMYGVTYDLLFTNTSFLNGFLFLAISYVVDLLLNKKFNFIKSLFTYYLTIIMYVDLIFIFTLFYNNYNFTLLTIKITNSMFFNTMYFIIGYLVFQITTHLFGNTKKNKSYF